MYRYKEVAHLQPPAEPQEPAPEPPPKAAPAPEVGGRSLVHVPPRQSRHIPVRPRIFYRDTIFWVSARILPDVMWITLLEHLLAGVTQKTNAALPSNPLQYTYYNMDQQELLAPLHQVSDAIVDEVLFIHKSEFVTAYDDRRRARLIADLLRTERLKVRHQHVKL